MQVYLTKCKSYLCRKHNDNKIDSFIIYIKKKNITKTIAGVIKNKITTYLKKKLFLFWFEIQIYQNEKLFFFNCVLF